MHDFRAALICATVANTVPRPKGSKPATPSDYMPKLRPKQPPAQTVDHMIAMARLHTLGLGGRVDLGPDGGETA